MEISFIHTRKFWFIYILANFGSVTKDQSWFCLLLVVSIKLLSSASPCVHSCPSGQQHKRLLRESMVWCNREKKSAVMRKFFSQLNQAFLHCTLAKNRQACRFGARHFLCAWTKLSCITLIHGHPCLKGYVKRSEILPRIVGSNKRITCAMIIWVLLSVDTGVYAWQDNRRETA